MIPINIPDIALKSPALNWQSEKYPTSYQKKVPLVIKMEKTVTSDLPFLKQSSTDLIAIAGNEYYCWVNSHGAVSAILPGGKQLGVKPGEFQVVKWHEIAKN